MTDLPNGLLGKAYLYPFILIAAGIVVIAIAVWVL